MTPTPEYDPESIRYWHAGGRCSAGRCNWAMLESAVQGGSGSFGTGSGRGERFGLAHLKADLETAADQLPLHWQSTAWVFSRQHRYSVLKKRRDAHPRGRGNTFDDMVEHPVPSVALDNVYYAMARSLGWSEEGQAA